MKTGVVILIGILVLFICTAVIIGVLAITGVIGGKKSSSSSSGSPARSPGDTPSGTPSRSPGTPAAYAGPSYASTTTPPATTPPATTPPATSPPGDYNPLAVRENITMTPQTSPEEGCPPGKIYYPNFRRCLDQVAWQTASSCQDHIESECSHQTVDIGDTTFQPEDRVVCNGGKNKWDFPTKAEYCSSFNNRLVDDPLDPCCN